MNAKSLIVMGVSGSGKSTLGAALAERLGWTFADADDYHPQANKEKMARGEALTDADRQPWLETLHHLLAEAIGTGQPLVLACSALKQKYRDTLIGDLGGVALVYANGSRELIEERMRTRYQSEGHFMPVSLLESQFATVEPPAHAIHADISKPMSELLPLVLEELTSRSFSDADHRLNEKTRMPG